MPFCKTIRILIFLILTATGSILLSSNISYSNNQNNVHMIQLNDDTINPVTAEYIVESIDRASQENVQCLIIKLDTPGGLLSSTRMIVKRMLASEVPIVVYIAPSGSRAGSAGVFITYASHIAVMAPSTNIGAAHPVQMGMKMPRKTNEFEGLKEALEGFKDAQNIKDAEKSVDQVSDKLADRDIKADDHPMESKILQDTVAFIKAIAHERNRNEEWAVRSVVKSESITSDEALENGVADFIADNDMDLIEKLNGRVVTINGKEITLQTKGADVQIIEMDSRQKFFNVLANPNIAYFLMILGFYGLLFEVTHPGFGVPGVLGLAFLILAFYSMQTLPTNYAGLALIILGLILLVTEMFTPTFGILTLGGVVCMILGSMLLFESVDPVMQVSRSAIFAFSFTTAAITIFLLRSVIRAHRSKVQSGRQGLIGEAGIAQVSFKAGKSGKIFVHGELWNALSDEDIQKGDSVLVDSIEGLTVKIKRK